MKNRLFSSLALAASISLLPALVAAESSDGGFFDLGTFTAPDDGGQFVQVHISSSLINIAARLTEKTEPEIAKILRGLQSVRVNVIGLNNDNRAALTEKVRKVRGELQKAGWDQVVTVREKKDDVGVYLKLRGEEAVEGVVVTVLDGSQAVLVNIVGDIRPEQIATVGERFHIDPLKELGDTIR